MTEIILPFGWNHGSDFLELSLLIFEHVIVAIAGEASDRAFCPSSAA